MKLLVVESDCCLAMSLCVELGQSGFEVELAHGPKGAARCGEQPYDLVIVGQEYGRPDGWEALRAVRAANESVPVLVLGEGRRAGDRELGLSLGADDYLRNPVDPSQLLARVDALLRRSGRCLPSLGAARLVEAPSVSPLR